MSEFPATSVGFTAKVMAAGRAIESRRPDRLFIDPFAERLAGDAVIEATIPRMEEYERQGRPFSVVRTRFLDDFLLLHTHEARQVVLLGAGMDTRAFRIDWPPGTQVYEVDQADVLDEKESLLKGSLPRSTRHAIRADLKEMRWVDHLINSGFRPAEPSLWVLEGVLYYLTPPEVHNLLIGINTITPKGSWLGADVINAFLLHGSDEWAKYWQSSCDDPESFFHAYGWKASALQPGEEGASYGRFTFQFTDRSIKEAPHIFFLTASKQA
jgi:methyltransferase (TIGR00027 family)